MEIKPSRFDYVKYDDLAQQQQMSFKEICQVLEKHVNDLKSPRAKALALTKLEELYMWIGKAIRDDQIDRNHGNTKLQEERTDS